MRAVFQTLLPVLAATSVVADTIHKTDGKAIEGVRVVDETLANVVYKQGNDERTVPSDEVLSIEFERMPRLVDEAESALAENDHLGALEQFDLYVEGQIANPSERRYKWAPAFAAWRTVQIRMELADLEGVVDSATRLVKSFPDSRYLPAAYLAKASAQHRSDKAAAAQRTLTELSELISARGLSKRWDLECRLATIQADTAMGGKDKRERLSLIASEAGTTYPTVRNRAYVVEGETYLEQAERSPSDATDLRGKAREVFERIIADPRADDETLAGAYTGLGDCLFYSGAAAGNDAELRQAVMSYLRVAVLYEAQSRYVPRALLGAVVCFDQLNDGKRKFDMKRQLKTRYPSSPQAADADKY